MPQLNHDKGTILRFQGKDRSNRHMGFVVSPTQIIELIDVDGSCKICLTDINKKHPLTERIPRQDDWNLWKRPPSGWSLEDNINRIEEAYKEFHGSEYNKIHNNCQHFAYKAVHGYSKSPNVEGIPSWLVEFGIADLFAGASEASSNSSATLVREYVKDAKVFIQAIQKGVNLAGSMSSSTGMSKNFNGVIGSVSTLLNIIKNNPVDTEQESLNDGESNLWTTAPTNTSTASVDIPNQIRQLGALLKEGLITEKEFDEKKRELLSRL